MKAIETGHIVIEPNVLGGAPHIAGHRIGVSDIAVWIAYQHARPEEIAEEYGLTLGEIHAALAYYFDHKEAVDRAIAESSARAEEMAERYPGGWRPGMGSLTLEG